MEERAMCNDCVTAHASVPPLWGSKDYRYIGRPRHRHPPSHDIGHPAVPPHTAKIAHALPLLPSPFPAPPPFPPPPAMQGALFHLTWRGRRMPFPSSPLFPAHCPSLTWRGWRMPQRTPRRVPHPAQGRSCTHLRMHACIGGGEMRGGSGQGGACVGGAAGKRGGSR